MMKPNNVTRLLDLRKIPYVSYELPAEKLGALEVAQWLKVSPSLVYKTIVVMRAVEGKPILALVPGDLEVDLKLVASVIGEKKVLLPTERDAERLTGLQAGGISPLALLNRGFQVLIDISAKGLEAIYISGGQRGLDICLSPLALAEVVRGRFAEITR
jgi:Cys-tRNA(Pro)/Cys-tRNA(Cys) deacylase